MNTHQIFKVFILPELLAIAERFDIMDSILSISLYGSMNYEPYDDKSKRKNPEPEEQDYDVWIVFKRDCLTEAKEFATGLFGANFKLSPDQSACILYDKIRLQTNLGEFLLAPMIVTEESYGLLQEDSLMPDGNILIPWYRPRARERPPKVPVCSTDLAWSEFDMRQAYLANVGLWRLMMPIIVRKDGLAALGTFVECALSGECFYGDYQKENELKQKLFLSTIRHLRLEKSFVRSDIPSEVYRMMTLETKAGSSFKEKKVRQFSQWLSK